MDVLLRVTVQLNMNSSSGLTTGTYSKLQGQEWKSINQMVREAQRILIAYVNWLEQTKYSVLKYGKKNLVNNQATVPSTALSSFYSVT